MPGPLDALRERFLRAEGRVKKEQYVPRPKWKITHCLSCQKKIEYVPKDLANFNGTLKCPHCGVRFKVSSLDEFVKLKNHLARDGFLYFFRFA